MIDSTNPAPGEAIFWIVRGVNCAGNGSYDTGSAGQAGPRDAAAAASANDCS